MLSEDIKKEVDQYNQEKKAQYKPTCPRMAKAHDQDHEEADSPDNPEPDLENHFHEDSFLCKTQVLKISWKHMVNTQQT